MIHGFDTDSPLCCEGIVGDGCGGGRFFFIQNNTLLAFDTITQESLPLLENICDATKITKDGCLLFIQRSNAEQMVFDLSLLKVIEE